MLEIRDLTCGYDSFSLKGINLKVEPGQILGIIGPNGSGKTTLLRAMSRAIKPEAGAILFEGKDIWQVQAKALAKELAVVSQNIKNIDSLTVEDYVLLGRTPYFRKFQFLETEKDRDIAERAMRLTDSFQLRGRLMEETSGGEAQLAAIARALTQEPKLLLLDEPTSHLDIAHKVKVLNLIRRLNREIGLTIVIVMHDLNLASEYCQNLLLLKEGSIYKAGTPQEVLTYSIIEEVYRTVVVVKKSPVSGKPHVFMVSQEDRDEK